MNIGSKRRDEWEQDEYRLSLLTLWRCVGKTEKQIAKLMGIEYSTLRKWKSESPIINEALAKGTEELACEMAGHMMKRARGYEYTETKTLSEGKIRKNSNIPEDTKIIKQERVTKHVPPDVGAQIFLMTNWQPDVWKNTQRVSATLDGSINAKVGNAIQIVLPDNGTGGAINKDDDKEK